MKASVKDCEWCNNLLLGVFGEEQASVLRCRLQGEKSKENIKVFKEVLPDFLKCAESESDSITGNDSFPPNLVLPCFIMFILFQRNTRLGNGRLSGQMRGGTKCEFSMSP